MKLNVSVRSVGCTPYQHLSDRLPIFTRKAKRAAVTELSYYVQERFMAQDWAPLAPRTVRERIAQGYPGSEPVLVRSGELMRAMTVGLHVDESTTGVKVFSSHENWIELQLGRSNMPARPMVPSSDTEKRHFLSRVQGTIVSLLRNTLNG